MGWPLISQRRGRAFGGAPSQGSQRILLKPRVADFEPELVPDADGNEARAPIPAIVVAGFEILRFGGFAELALLLGGLVEDDAEVMGSAVGEVGREVESVADDGAFEGCDDFVV